MPKLRNLDRVAIALLKDAPRHRVQRCMQSVSYLLQHALQTKEGSWLDAPTFATRYTYLAADQCLSIIRWATLPFPGCENATGKLRQQE